MKAAIILPTKNRKKLLEEAIEDVLHQSYRDFHLIVIDHNSTDGTAEVVKKIRDPRVIYIHHLGYQDGAWSPKNKGLKNLPDDSFGVLFRDDDDRYASRDSLSYLVDAALDLGDSFGICVGDYIEVDANGKHIRKVSGNISSTEEIAERCWFPVKAAIFNIDLVRRVGLLPPIRSRETILWAYFIVNLIENVCTNKTIYYIGKDIIHKYRHDGEISQENLVNGCRSASEALIRNIHHAIRCNRRPSELAKLYPLSFFDFARDEKANLARQIVPSLVKLFKPRSVVSAGCGLAYFLAEFEKYGINVLGIDGSEAVFGRAYISDEKIRIYDLRTPLRLGRYDLCMCMEVAEHIEAEFADVFVDNLAGLSNRIIFTAAPPGQPGEHHLNCQPKEYWIAKFERRGFSYDDIPTDCVKGLFPENGRLYFYRQNLMVFERR